MIAKHIDPAPPLDVIKAVWDKIAARQWTDLGLWANVGYLISWALEFLDQKIDPDKPIFVQVNFAWANVAQRSGSFGVHVRVID